MTYPLATRDAILAVDDRMTEDLEVPEWQMTVRVRAMTGGERDAYEQMSLQEVDGQRKMDMRNMRAKLVAMTVVDESGGLMFGPSEVALLAAKSAAALDRVFNVAARLNGLSANAVESAAKNSEAAPSGVSTSA